MKRAIVSRKTLDALVRAKLATLEGCGAVEALPVIYSEKESGRGCNWTIPGWVGDADAVRDCVDKLNHYLDFLQAQFDIPVRGTADSTD